MDARTPRARCVLIEGDRITTVGQKDADCARAGVPVVDAHGATLIPGFNDAHVHFGLMTTLGRAPEIPLLPRERWRDAVRAAAARLPTGAWAVVRSSELPAGV